VAAYANLLARVVWAIEALELGDIAEALRVLRDLEMDLVGEKAA
jgi:hypothetical protein